jgi:LPS O-antigen subunit length determinant protein (WzzB/FepE family)
MAKNEIIDVEQTEDNWKVKILIAGTVLGALIGLGGAYLMVQRAETKDEKVNITVGKGVKLGLISFTLLRQIAQLEE